MVVTTDSPDVIFLCIARISFSDLSDRKRHPPNFAQSCNVASEYSDFAQSCNAFLDLEELDQALELHFAGTLDHVDSIRANLPLDELVAGKPLISRLESSEVVAALKRLPIEHSAVIRFCHGNHDIGVESESLDSADYAHALIALAAELIKDF